MDKPGVPNTRRFCACWGRKGGGVPKAGLSSASSRAVGKGARIGVQRVRLASALQVKSRAPRIGTALQEGRWS